VECVLGEARFVAREFELSGVSTLAESRFESRSLAGKIGQQIQKRFSLFVTAFEQAPS
jgi:hypothetical protein